LVGEFSLGDIERLGGDVDVLETKFVRKVDKGQRNEIAIETLREKHASETWVESGVNRDTGIPS